VAPVLLRYIYMKSLIFALILCFSVLLGASVGRTADEPYAITSENMPDVDYAYMPDLYRALQESYLKVFRSQAGQEILASFETCDEAFFKKYFELDAAFAKKALPLCEQAKLSFPKEKSSSISNESFNEEDEFQFKLLSKRGRVILDPRRHYLKVLQNRQELSSYTYLANQTIISLPWNMAYDENILSAFLLHETAVYFDAQNPLDIFGFMLRHRLTADQFNVEPDSLVKVWANPFIAEALAVLRAYQQEQKFLSELPLDVRQRINHPWYSRLQEAKHPRTCGVLLIDFISEVLMRDSKYLKYRWDSSYIAAQNSAEKKLSASEIMQKTRKDIEAFLAIQITSSRGKKSLCEVAMVPEFSSEGTRWNNGPRPPIKPGSQADKNYLGERRPEFDIRTNWDVYDKLKLLQSLKPSLRKQQINQGGQRGK